MQGDRHAPYNAPWRKVLRRIEYYHIARKTVLEYMEKCYATHGVSTYERIGGRPNTPGDPTGKRAIMIAEMPQHIRRAIKWVKAVDRTLIDLSMMDYAEHRNREHGRYRVLLMLINREGWDEFGNPCPRNIVEKITKECDISRRTFYRWRQQICEMIAQRLGLMN